MAVQQAKPATALPDSMLTCDKAEAVGLQDRAMADSILHEMRRRKLETPFRISMSEAVVRYNSMDFKEARDIFVSLLDSKEAKTDRASELDLINSIVQSSELIGSKEEVSKYLKLLLEKSEEYEDHYYRSLALHMLGKQLFYDGDRTRGIGYVRQGAALMAACTKKVDYRFQLYSQLKCLASLYCDSGQFDKALEVMEQCEALMGHESGWTSTRDIRVQARRELLAKKASLLARMGHAAAADSAYVAWKAIPWHGRDNKDVFIVPYLRLRGLYADAISIYSDRINWLRESGDTLSTMAWASKWNLAELYYDQGDYRRSADTYVQVLEITDTMRVRTAATNAQQLEAVYQNQQQQEEIYQLRIWFILLSAFVVIILVAGVLLMRYNHIVRQKNKAMLATINEFRSQHDAGKRTEADPSTMAEESADLHLFLSMDRAIDEQQLYLSPDFGRSQLCQLTGQSKERVARLIADFSGCSRSEVYINRKRVQYAARLMKEHPEWTMAAVAEASGIMNTTTFNRSFRQTFGMTPTEYMKQQK